MSYWGPAEYNTGDAFTDIDKLLEYMFQIGVNLGTLAPLKKVVRTVPPLQTLESSLYLGDKTITKEFMESAARAKIYQYSFMYPCEIFIYSNRDIVANDMARDIFNKCDIFISERVTLYDYPRFKFMMPTDFDVFETKNRMLHGGFNLNILFTKQITVLATGGY